MYDILWSINRMVLIETQSLILLCNEQYISVPLETIEEVGRPEDSIV
jgi:hypothetical protein